MASPTGIGALLFGTGSLLRTVLPSGQRVAGTTTQRSRTEFRPEDLARIQARQRAIEQALPQVIQQVQQISKVPQQIAFERQLRLQPIGEASQLDRLARLQLAQGAQALGRQQLATQQALQQRFASSPGVASALAARANLQRALSVNPLQAQALQQQAERQRANLQAALQQRQLQLGAARLQSQLASAPLSVQQSALSNLLQAGQALGEQIAQTQQNQRISQGLFK